MSDVDSSLYEYRKPTSALKILAIIGTALLVLIVGGWLVARLLMPRVARQGQIQESTNNLRILSQMLAERSMSKGWPRYEGKAFVLSLAAARVIDVGNPSNTNVFFSPADEERDPGRVSPDAWREVTAQALKSGRSFDGLTSYAGRRNRDRESMITTQVQRDVGPILADLHFEDIAIVGFTDGSARVLDRSELGLGPDDPIVAGEASKSPILRALSDE